MMININEINLHEQIIHNIIRNTQIGKLG